MCLIEIKATYIPFALSALILHNVNFSDNKDRVLGLRFLDGDI